jgi:hypothetical protein
MRAISLTAPRILAVVGGALIVVASVVPWHRYDVVTASRSGSAARARGAVDLWSVDPVAAVLIVIGALAAVLLLVAAGRHLRTARHLAGALVLAIIAYAVVRSVDAPDLTSVMGSARHADVLSAGVWGDNGVLITVVGCVILLVSVVESRASIPAPSTTAPNTRLVTETGQA